MPRSLVQPSKFEGRGAITEEAVVRGRKYSCVLICRRTGNGLAGAIFFDVDDAVKCPSCCGAAIRTLTKMRRPSLPRASLARTYGERVMKICEDVIEKQGAARANPRLVVAGGTG